MAFAKIGAMTQVVIAGKTHTFDCASARAVMCPLQSEDRGPRTGQRRHILLLRPLRRSGRCDRTAQPGLAWRHQLSIRLHRHGSARDAFGVSTLGTRVASRVTRS